MFTAKTNDTAGASPPAIYLQETSKRFDYIKSNLINVLHNNNKIVNSTISHGFKNIQNCVKYIVYITEIIHIPTDFYSLLFVICALYNMVLYNIRVQYNNK